MADKAPETKQAVVTAEQTKTPPAQHFKVPGFKGGYRGITFDDDCISDRLVPAATVKELTEQFPALKPEPLIMHKFGGNPNVKDAVCNDCGRKPEHTLHHVSE